jgi:GMP synthase-like glutamine amidotransferase
MKTCVCLQHVPFEGPGHLHRILEDLGYRIEKHVVPTNGLPGSPGDFLLVMGGPMSVNDSDKWVASEMEFIRKAVAAGTPFLGICLGSQFLAKAMGGNVAAGKSPEIGMTALQRTEAGAMDRAFKHFPEIFEAFEWHGEGIELPENAVRLAGSALFDVQAFRVGLRAYGFLFHVEVEQDNVAALCRNCESDLVRARRSAAEVEEETGPHFELMQGYLRRFITTLLK